jgi:hypothetical protein
MYGFSKLLAYVDEVNPSFNKNGVYFIPKITLYVA